MAETTTPATASVVSGDVLLKSPIILAEKLIGSVTVSPSTARPGQSVLIEVLDGSGKPYAANSPVTVTIDGVPTAHRYVQYLGAGTRTLLIRAVHGTQSETATATVTVAGDAVTFRRTLTAPIITPVAKLQLTQTIGAHYVATFSLGAELPVPPPATPAAAAAAAAAAAKPEVTSTTTRPAVVPAPPTVLDKAISAVPAAQRTVHATQTQALANDVKATAAYTVVPSLNLTVTPQQTSYKWNFGDGTTATTQSPTVTHDYFPAIKVGMVSQPFDVTCTSVHDNVTVTRTLVLNSAYEMCKQFGTIVPNVDSDVYANFQKGVGFTASMTVYNVEAEPITLTSMGFTPTSDNVDAQLPAPTFTTMKTPITIKANGASAFGIVIPISELSAATKLGSAVPGFIVYYKGSFKSGNTTTPVLFSRTFRIPLTQSGGAWLTQAASAPKITLDLANFSKAALTVATDPKLKLAADAGAISADEATNTVAIALSTPPHTVAAKSQARAAIRSGILSASQKGA
ncbi:MAG TPA: PKD domain-containing protein [Candidatus Sulfotelmatobacter sp.]|nr:PKD domain-containing protein [Candidatus Sulfotelmatobacter sp.]